MKPVYCGEIAVGECKDFVSAPQGSAWGWSRVSAVFLVVKGQRQLGIRRNLPVHSLLRCGDLRVPGVEPYSD